MWANAEALLEGYTAALDEVERLRRVMVDETAGSRQDEARRWLDELVTLRTSIGELKLVLEQQDRDLTAARDMNRHYEQERDAWPLAYRQRAQKTDKLIAVLEAALRKIHDDAAYDNNDERYLEIAGILDQGDPCTEATTK
jgi:hypothetical protein